MPRTISLAGSPSTATLNGIPGYYAIIRKPDEVRTLGLQMAYSARGIKPEEKS